MPKTTNSATGKGQLRQGRLFPDEDRPPPTRSAPRKPGKQHLRWEGVKRGFCSGCRSWHGEGTGFCGQEYQLLIEVVDTRWRSSWLVTIHCYHKMPRMRDEGLLDEGKPVSKTLSL